MLIEAKNPTDERQEERARTFAEHDTDELHEKPLISRLGEHLVEHGRLDAAGLARAERASVAGQGRLDQLLVKLGLVSERHMAEAFAHLLSLPLARKSDYPLAPVEAGRVSVQFLQREGIVPLGDGDDGVDVAFADPLAEDLVDAMALAMDRPLRRWVGVPAEIEAALTDLYGSTGSSAGSAGHHLEDGHDAGSEDLERLEDLAREAPVIRLVNALISRAVEERASDIHLESFHGRLAVRYRVDGDLVDVEPPAASMRAAIISRVKIMAGLDIAERRQPQDGRIRMAVRGSSIDLRVSTLPMLHGESVVLRILDRGGLELNLPNMGIQEPALGAFRRALAEHNGIVLVTGATGSGKTSTLYAGLLELTSSKRKIITVEDPVEYELAGINQIQTRNSVGLSFAAVLRSILRHDPDIIMVGEIRDRETAEIAVQAALTGHLVLSTLHTNGAASAVGRLLDMGIEGYLVTSTLRAVMAQRLLRRLCPHCREAWEPPAELARKLGIEAALAHKGGKLWQPRGCEHCSGRGYHGRVAVTEVMSMSDDLHRLVLRGASVAELNEAARAEGMRSLYRDGIWKALEGLTSLDEAMRVARED